MLVSVYRYNPETDKVPYIQDFEIELICLVSDVGWVTGAE